MAESKGKEVVAPFEKGVPDSPDAGPVPKKRNTIEQKRRMRNLRKNQATAKTESE